MLRTVVHQTYTGNLAVDTSGMFNHGIPIQVAPLRPGFDFSSPGSRISINPSVSLRDLECIRAGVSFTLKPRGAAHRYNLAEGYLSFALYVNPDLSVSGTILDATGNWTGASSPPNSVTPNNPHTAIVECDGISVVRLILDGKIVGENYKVSGSIRDIGNLGLAVGHWPDPPNQYTFEGVIFEFLLQKYDPQHDLTRGIDPCCFDRGELGRWFRNLAKRGITVQQLSDAADALKSATKDAVIAIRGGDKAKTETLQTAAAAIAFAMQQRDFQLIEQILQSQLPSVQNLPGATLASLTKELQAAFAKFGLTWSDWCEFLRLLCIDICHIEHKGSRHGC